MKLYLRKPHWFSATILMILSGFILYNWFYLLVTGGFETAEQIFGVFLSIHLLPVVVLLLVKPCFQNFIRGLVISAFFPLLISGSNLILMIEELYYDDLLQVLAGQYEPLLQHTFWLMIFVCYHEFLLEMRLFFRDCSSPGQQRVEVLKKFNLAYLFFVLTIFFLIIWPA